MVTLGDLWLPILLSSVFVFVVSSLVHMALGYHKSDMKPLPNEGEVLSALRKLGVPPGTYMFPSCGSMKEMSSPEMLDKLNQGPVGQMNVLPPGPWRMGRSLGQWFVFTLVVSFFVAYLSTLSLPTGCECSQVFRFTATAAILGYAFSNVTDSIWKGIRWSTTAKFVFDGVLYGLTTGATFMWLWPAGAGL